MEAERQPIAFFEVSTAISVPARFIAPRVTVKEYDVKPSLADQQYMPLPTILPIRVTRTSRPPIGLQEGVEAYERYITERDARLTARRQPLHSTVRRAS